MAIKKYMDDNALTYYHSKVKTLLAGKVDKESGKGLSTNDLTDALKTKYDNAATKVDQIIETGGEPNVIETVKVNGTALTPDANKAVDVTIPTVNNATLTIQKNGTTVKTFTANASSNVTANITVPTNNNELTNGAGYQTSSDVQSAINDALEDITGIDFQVVTSLPATGKKGIIYLMPNSGSSPNIYDEYIWLSSSSSYEKIGTTDVDLSGYQLSSELVAVTNAEIDTIVAS